MHPFHSRRCSFAGSAVLVLAALPFAPLSALGQSTSSGTITGTVTDPTGAVIPGATITVTDLTTKISRTATSGKEGLYVLPDVQPGTYDVTATKTGFSKDEIPALNVSVGTQANASFRMTVGAEGTTVEVQASNTDLETLNASTGQTVDPVMVASLPAIGRDVATFATLQPGVTPGGNVGGTTADQATFQLDGGSNSSDMDGTQGVYTTSNVNSTTAGFIGAAPGGVMPMPQDSIEEFKVSTSGQTADFNNSSGSQSQIVTKRGHDQFHGTAYEYYLDSNIGANTWQNNFPGSGYTPKASYHYSRFGGAAGGPILPNKFGGKTYLFANFEGFQFPQSATYERSVPSYQFLQTGQMTFNTPCGPVGTANAANTSCTYSAAQLKAADPRGIGMNQTLTSFYNSELPVAPASNSGATGATGTAYAGVFDPSCGVLSGALCDSVNTIGYRANYHIPQSSNFLATRLDHDFGAKWHLTASYRYYSFVNLTGNQVDIGGVLPGDTLGVPVAKTPRPQQPWFVVGGLTTNITSNLTNDFHYSLLRNFWQWKGAGAPPQVSGAGGAIEPLGENSATTVNGNPAGTNVLSPYNVNAQNIRTRIWDGKDNFLRDDLTLLKGDHLIQFGGQFQHNFNYHQRTDNGASINYTPTYLIGDSGGGGNVTYAGATTSPAGTVGLGTVGANANIAYARLLDTYYGIVTDTQVANTYSNNGGTLSLNPSYTPIGAHTSVPYYNIYATDTWHVSKSLTINYGLSYALEMPPSERNGNQVMLTDVSGNALRVQQFLASKQAAAAQGTVYNPEIGFALIRNVNGGRKYPYDPFYGAVSPRVSFALNPGGGGTVIRGGYGRLYARINGDAQVLNPLLSPGLILATQCKYVQSNDACNQTNFTDSTAFRFGSAAGLDGISPILASAPPPATLLQPYHPGYDGPGVALASPLDPSLRPSDVDTFNFSIQRQLNRKMLIEVGYIGRVDHHEYIMLNPNQVPYNMSLGGQTFSQAYDAIETAYGCTVSAALCKSSATPIVAAQPFFESALSGGGYCNGYSSCTAAVIAKQGTKFRNQQVFSLWQALDNNKLGATASGFNFARSLMGTPTSNTTYGSAGQVVTGLSMGTPAGWSNYHGMYVSFKTSNYHGVTLQENFTYAKALGLGAYNQSTSSIAAEDNFNLREQYGRQSFDQKLIFNTFIVWQTPWYPRQNGIAGRLAGGWTLSPVIVAGTGQPLQCVSNNSGQNFGGEDGSNFTDSENCIFTAPANAAHTYRNIPGSGGIGTNTKGTGYAAVNTFTNPAAVYGSVRPPILGIDTQDEGSGPISGLGYLNIDFSVNKKLAVWEHASLEFTGVFMNLMNHIDFSNPSLSLQSVTNWGTTKTQGNQPRQIQMGLRASF